MTNYGAGYIAADTLRGMPFRSLGKNVLVHERAVLVNIENIAIGDNTRIDGGATIVATAPVTIGSYVHIGAECYLAGGGGIEMEDFSGLSQGVKVYSVSDDYSGARMTNPTVPKEYLGVQAAKVTVGRHVIIGAGSVILPGVVLGEGSAVGALSLVRTATAPWGIYFGTPARRISDRKKDLLQFERQLLGTTS